MWDEVANGERVGKMKYKVEVFEHKTGKIKPGVVFLTNWLGCLIAYKDIILPQVRDLYMIEEDYFFLSFEGKPINEKHA